MDIRIPLCCMGNQLELRIKSFPNPCWQLSVSIHLKRPATPARYAGRRAKPQLPGLDCRVARDRLEGLSMGWVRGG
jgi:hypothetical protein